MAINDGGPAFPSVGEGFGNPLYSASGMTLRDWFAAHVVCGLLAMPGTINNREKSSEAVVTFSYHIADLMIAEREKGGAR